MTTTPLFDRIARSAGATAPAPADTTISAGIPSAAPSGTALRGALLAAPAVRPEPAEDARGRIHPDGAGALPVTAEQCAIVEALGDRFIRVVVDALVAELDRVTEDRAVRA